MVHTGQKVNNLNLNLYFISINKLRRAWFCARGGKLNIANACIYARASYFRAGTTRGNSPPAYIRARFPIPTRTPFPLTIPSPPFPPFPPLPLLSPSSYFPSLPSPSSSLPLPSRSPPPTARSLAATAGSSLAASAICAFACARLPRHGASAFVVVAAAAEAAALRCPAPSLGLNSRDGAQAAAASDSSLAASARSRWRPSLSSAARTFAHA